jgi:hypothetical protein
MLVTVKEAKELECRSVPFEVMGLNPESLPQYPPICHPRCSANKCMKWTWLQIRNSEGVEIPIGERRGYCGLVMRP